MKVVDDVIQQFRWEAWCRHRGFSSGDEASALAPVSCQASMRYQQPQPIARANLRERIPFVACMPNTTKGFLQTKLSHAHTGIVSIGKPPQVSTSTVFSRGKPGLHTMRARPSHVLTTSHG